MSNCCAHSFSVVNYLRFQNTVQTGFSSFFLWPLPSTSKFCSFLRFISLLVSPSASLRACSQFLSFTPVAYACCVVPICSQIHLIVVCFQDRWMAIIWQRALERQRYNLDCSAASQFHSQKDSRPHASTPNSAQAKSFHVDSLSLRRQFAQAATSYGLTMEGL